jgi:hypothetical protein
MHDGGWVRLTEAGTEGGAGGTAEQPLRGASMAPRFHASSPHICYDKIRTIYLLNVPFKRKNRRISFFYSIGYSQNHKSV